MTAGGVAQARLQNETRPRILPIYVVTPPRTLLLDIAGPIKVLRKTNLEQAEIRFTVRYIGPQAEVRSSVGLALAGIAPCPRRSKTGRW